MAVFNGERFLARQLESLLNQTMPPAEIAVRDDGSTDGTEAIVRSFERRSGSTRICYRRNPERLGSSANFERAVADAEGEVIFLADQDDVWRPEKIERMMRQLESSPGADGVFCDSAVVDEELHDTGCRHLRNRGFDPERLRCADAEEMLALFLKRVPPAGHDMAFRSSLRELLLPFPPLAACHDTWIGMALAALGKWCCVAEPLTLFRQHGNNASDSGRKPGWRQQWREARRAVAGDACAWNAALYAALIGRVGERVSPETAAVLRDRMEHSQARSQMACPRLLRLAPVAGEIVNGRYFRYGRGWRNVIQDLMLRGISGKGGSHE